MLSSPQTAAAQHATELVPEIFHGRLTIKSYQRHARLVFVVSTLALLYSFGGGNFALFIGRLPLLGLLLGALAYVSVLKTGQLQSLSDFDPRKFATALGCALLSSVALFLLGYAFSQKGPDLFSGLSFVSIENAFGSLNLFSMLLLILLIIPAWSLISRGLLGRLWGANAVGFLDALIAGFGLQMRGAFEYTLLTSLVAAYLEQRLGLLYAVLYQVGTGAIALFALKLGVRV